MNFRFWSVAFWKNTGYSLKSSPYLARRMISIASIGDAQVIVELGAGEGQVTGYILQQKSIHTRFIAIENDHERFVKLTEKYGHLCEVYEMSAAHLESILESNSVDIIISTLPLGSISQPGVGHILASAQSVLKPIGRFVQHQYVLANKKDIKKYFHIDSISWELRNIGPTFIYQAHKK